MYDPADWYWVVGSNYARVWSSSRRTYVPASDQLYAEWTAAGNRASSILTEDELGAVLDEAFPAGSPRGPRKVTPLAFQQRFTDDEWDAICAGAMASAQILGFLIKFAAASEIDMHDSVTIAGMNSLVNAGLLAADRPAQILSTSIPA